MSRQSEVVDSFLRCDWKKSKAGNLWTANGVIFTYQVRLAEWQGGQIHLCEGFLGTRHTQTSTIHRNLIARAMCDAGLSVFAFDTGEAITGEEVCRRLIP